MKNKLTFYFKPVLIITALLAGSYFVLWIEKSKPSDFGFYKSIFTKEETITKSGSYPLRQQSKLSAEEMEMARIAWKYFQNNYIDSTGLVNASDKYPAMTIWDITSGMMGIISAHEIGIIDSIEFHQKISTALKSMAKIPLFQDKLPHKVYNAYTLKMVDYNNDEVEEGLGWTAVDIGRFFVLVNKIIRDYPKYTTIMKQVIGRWNLNEMVKDGYLQGTFFTSKDRRPKLMQEGRLGYEEYAAKGLTLLNYDLWEAMSYSNFTRFLKFGKIQVPYDSRESNTQPSYNFTLSEPYMLDGIEYGWNNESKEIAWRIYNVQKNRYKKTGYVTAVSEDHIDTLPYFVYNTIINDGEKWICISEAGDDATEFKTISTKAAFAWHVLFDDDYSKVLFDAVKNLNDPEKGWYSGLYEKRKVPNKALNVNTNGIILECLNYKQNGALVGLKSSTSLAVATKK